MSSHLIDGGDKYENIEKAAIICAVVMMVSMIPIFAFHDNNTGTLKNLTKTTNQTCLKNSAFDGDHHKTPSQPE